jgi:phosphatidylglycerol lysyltransferase
MRLFSESRGGYSTAVLGAQPVWSPASFLEKFEADSSLRAQRSRALNKGVVIEEWPPERAEGQPDLCRVLSEWLATRGLPPMHFLVEPQTLDMLRGRRVFVALQADRPIGFLVLSPVPARRGWLTEQFVRGREGPNGTVELMLFHAVTAICDDGDLLVTMGIVPLARCDEDAVKDNPLWLRFITRWAKAHGRRFYNFEGLEWFKDKFHPDEWEPIYVISREDSFSFRTLYAIAAAFTGGSPVTALLKGLGRAVQHEIARLLRR